MYIRWPGMASLFFLLERADLCEDFLSLALRLTLGGLLALSAWAKKRICPTYRPPVIPAKLVLSRVEGAGIQSFRLGPLFPAFAGTSLHLRKQVQG